MPNPQFNLTPEQAEAVKRAYEQAQKEGHPLAALAEQIAKGIQMEQLGGEAIQGTPIVDEGILYEYDIEMPSDPQFFVDKEERIRNIKMVPGPEEMGGFQQMKITAERLPCPVCADNEPKQGYELEDLQFEPTHIVQCGNCFNYIWITATEKPNEN
ncbi:MAG: hypothetical protein ACYSTI_10520 [Planctomycetota bacterium]|jgi:hypothetical protein